MVKEYTIIEMAPIIKEILSMERSVDKEVLLSPITLESKHFGNKITFKVEVKYTTIMVTTMRANFLYHKKMGKGSINGRIRQGIRGSLEVIILLETAESNILITNSMKEGFLMGKDKDLEFIDIPMEMSSKESGRMMKS